MEESVILCVDDEAYILASLQEQLQRQFGDTYIIEVAKSGQEALALIDELQSENVAIPVILSDQIMPGMAGDQFLITAHQRLPNTFKILLTGNHDMQAVQNAVNHANLYRYIDKPWQDTDLLLTVQEALHSYQQRDQLQQQQHRLAQANQHLAQSLTTLQATLDATADGILVLDQANQVVHYNQKLLVLFGLIPEAPLPQSVPLRDRQEAALDTPQAQQSPRTLVPRIEAQLQENPELRQMLQTCKLAPYCAELSVTTTDGEKNLECYGQPQWLAGEIIGQVWSLRDITARKRAADIIQYQAHHDSLTGLANRIRFNQCLRLHLENAVQAQKRLAILFVDLDRFKLVNDTLGHPVGDVLLKQVVQRLKNCLRQGDLLARWGGDEFTLLQPSLEDADDASGIAQRIINALSTRFEVADYQIHIGASVGIAIYPKDGDSADVLLKHADAALYAAKVNGRNRYAHFTTALSQAAQRNFEIETALHTVLERQELSVHYQPQLDVQTHRIAAVEALVRWFSPEQGWISPQDFIPRAEHNGLIHMVGRWVLQQACAQAEVWRQQGLPLTMSVNLSPRQLQHPQLIEMVTQVLEETGLPPEFLELEITETVALEYPELSCEQLRSLQQMGVKIALDDFGTGYSSLSHLRQLPLNKIKIDRSFIQELFVYPQDEAIVRAVVALASGLDLQVVAEGVETAALAFRLKNLGCHYLQGYWFSRPLPGPETEKLLIENLSSLRSRSTENSNETFGAPVPLANYSNRGVA